MAPSRLRFAITDATSPISEAPPLTWTLAGLETTLLRSALKPMAGGAFEPGRDFKGPDFKRVDLHRDGFGRDPHHIHRGIRHVDSHRDLVDSGADARQVDARRKVAHR